MSSELLDQRIARLETRLETIEWAMQSRGLLPAAGLKGRPVAEPPRITADAIPSSCLDASQHLAEASVGRDAIALPPRLTPPPLVNPPSANPPLRPSAERAALERKVLQYPRVQPISPPPQSEIEKTIGLKWAGWIGAIVFVIGAVLGVKYAYDQGWLTDLIPNWMWLTLIALTGFSLIGAGEWVYRRINKLSAVGLYGAGVAILFVASYVGHAYYEFYSPGTAFTLMALSAIVGAGVAMRGNLVSIAILSLLGANIAPMLLRDPHAPLVSFLMYLLAMQLVAVSLAAWGRSGKWWTLRGLSLLMIAAWMTSILADSPIATLAMVFTILFAALYHVEIIVSNLIRNEPARGEGAAGLVFGTFVTAAVIGALLWIHRGETELVQVLWVLGTAAVCGAIAGMISFIKRLDGLLAASYALQAMALLLLAVPVGFSGVNVEIGWALMAIVVAMIAAISGRSIASGTALAAWMLAAVHLLARVMNPDELAVFITLAGDSFDTRALAAVALALVGHGVVLLATRRDHPTIIAGAQFVILASAVMWCAAGIRELHAASATMMMLVLAWMMVLEDRLAPQLKFRTFGGTLLLLAAAKWTVYDTFLLRFHRSAGILPVMFNLQMFNALLLIASAIATLRAMSKDNVAPAAIRTALKLAIALVALLALSFEIDRWFGTATALSRFSNPRLAEQMALSIFWACFAVGTVGVGFRLREAPLRYFGLATLALTLFKVVLVDLSGISQGYRILSFIGVGLLMLGTSVLYGKLSPRLLGESDGASIGTP